MEDLSYIKRAKKFRTKKSLGQNFLVDKKVIDLIISEINEGESVLEIGAGIGFVTEGAVKIAHDLTAIEIDTDAIKFLKTNCLISIANSCNKCDFKVVEQDILKTNLWELQNENKDKFKIIANIPYYITSPILVHLLGEIDEVDNKNRKAIDEIILMVQYEVAKRLVANEKSASIKDYGLLSILVQQFCDVEIIKKISKYSFYPAPKVDSALVRLKLREEPKVKQHPYLRRVIKAAFSMRRKNLKNCLLAGGFSGVEDGIRECGFDLNIRGEKLSVEDFLRLSEVLYEKNKN